MTDDVSDDGFLGGRLRLLQPRSGHRVGTDAALLAAAARCFVDDATELADFGAGVGAVGLALVAAGARRATLVERDVGLAALGSANAARNGLEARAAALAADVAALGRPSGPESPAPGSLDLVASNPPFDDSRRFQPSPDVGRAGAHAAGADLLEIWTRAAARLLRPGGVFVLIHRPEALGSLLAAMDGRFGDLALRPVHPRRDAAASRMLIAARKGRRGALKLLPGLALHEADGRFTEAADAAQRGDAPIVMA